MTKHPQAIASITIDTGQSSYPIFIGRTLNLPLILKQYLHTKVLIVVDSNTEKLFLSTIVQSIRDSKKDIFVDKITIATGEEHKSWHSLQSILNRLIENNHDRKTTIVALGGGIVGDIAGFAAAIYLRGVEFIQIPTTLLAQVDSSIGGKTAINHREGKNLIGCFHQPCLVAIDLQFLQTLSQREFSAGMAEVIKYGLIYDVEFYQWLIDNMDSVIAREEATMQQLILRSCQIKAKIVEQDEREKGQRAILNFGHSFGHALEAATQYKQYLHGEAVALGMLIALQMSIALQPNCTIKTSQIGRLKRALQQLQLPVVVDVKLSLEQWVYYLRKDKKVLAGVQRFILLESIGCAKVSVIDVKAPEFYQTLQQWSD